MRTEHDFLGEMNVPDNVYYGVQTMRAMENFHITGEHLDPDFIQAMAIVKKAAALANMETGRLDKKIGNALVQAASEIIDGQWLDQFPVDPIRGCRYFDKYEHERSIVQPGFGNHGQRKRPLRPYLAEQPRQHGPVDERRLPDEHQSLPEHERQEIDGCAERTGNRTGRQSRRI